jgi:D-alanyl-D-alanine carboxypeptidase (penicillin-binding protein 5/6)
VSRFRSLAAVGLALVFCALATFWVPAARGAGRPPITAPSAIVVEASTGDVAYAKRAGDSRPIASVTKLMTALLTLEGPKLSTRVRAIGYRAAAVESQINLRAGERLTVADLLRGLLLASANDAAATLADAVSGSRRAFVRDMNRRARVLGLRSTRFRDPIGLDSGSRSSASDLVKLTSELRRFSFFRRTVDRPNATLESGDRRRVIANRNTLVREHPWVSGVKTGHTTRAGYALVGSATRRKVTLISVVLGASSEAARNADTLALLRFASTRYRRSRGVVRGRVYARVPIRYRRGAEVALVAPRTLTRVVRRGQRLRRRVMSPPGEVEGPIRKGQRLGQVEVLVGPKRVATVELLSAVAVPAAGVTQRSKDYLTRPLGFSLAVLVAGASVVAVLRRRATRNHPRPRRGEAEAT